MPQLVCIAHSYYGYAARKPELITSVLHRCATSSERTLAGPKDPEFGKRIDTKDSSISKMPFGLDEDKSQLTNMFYGLHIEEPSETPLGQPIQTKEPARQLNFEFDEGQESKASAIWCLLQDMRDIRYEIRALWHQYTAGKVGLNIAGTLTEYAVGMLHRVLIEFNNEHNNILFYEEITDFLGLETYCFDTEAFISPVPDDTRVAQCISGRSAADLAQLLCPRGYMLLEGFQTSIKKCRESRNKPPALTPGDPLASHPYGNLLHSLLPDFETFTHVPEADRDVLHAMILSVQRLADETDRPPAMSDVVILQIALDVQYILLHNPEAELAKFHTRRSAGEKSLEQYGVSWQTTTVELQQKHGEMFKDPYYEARQHSLNSKRSQGQSAYSPFRVYKAFPSNLGHIIHISLVTTQLAGLSLCNDQALVLSLAYVYRAARRIRALSKPWPDMEFIISTQSQQRSSAKKEREFVLEPDSGISSLPQCFARSLGMGLSVFRHGARLDLPKRDSISKHSTQLRSTCPLTNIFTNLDNFGLSVYGRPTMECLDMVKQFKHRSERLEEVVGQYARIGKVTPPQLLYCVEEVLMEDDASLKFDFINFGALCHEFMQKLRSSFEIELALLLGHRWKDDRATPYEIVYWVLWDVADRFQSPKDLERSTLYRFAPLIEAHIARHGDVCTRATQEESISASTTYHTRRDVASSATTMSEDDFMTIRDFLGLPTNETKPGRTILRLTN